MPDHFYVYPSYLSRGRSRSDGRRLPASESVADVTAEEIAQAATRLGFRAEIEVEKQYPRQVAAYAGRVKVLKRAGIPKTKFLRLLAGELARRRVPGGHP